jgi:hypothetical protein
MTPDNFDRLQSSVDRIEKAIVGDAQMGHRGLAQRVEHIEHRVDSHDKKLLQWGAVFAVIGVGASWLFKIFT